MRAHTAIFGLFSITTYQPVVDFQPVFFFSCHLISQAYQQRLARVVESSLLCEEDHRCGREAPSLPTCPAEPAELGGNGSTKLLRYRPFRRRTGSCNERYPISEKNMSRLREVTIGRCVTKFIRTWGLCCPNDGVRFMLFFFPVASNHELDHGDI